MLSERKYRCYSFFVLAYTLLVILWGAWVRISHSGDGCGESWPLCRQELLPSSHDVSMWVELSHRLSSGLFLVAIIALVVLTYRYFPRPHWLRRWVWLVLLLTLTEAGVGALLVLKGLVADDSSVMRAYIMSLHMLNSMALVGAITICWQGSSGDWVRRVRRTKVSRLTPLLMFGFVLISCTGAIAALAGTLFPADSLLTGVLQDLSKESHFLVRLRVWHPLAATLIGLGLFSYGSFLFFAADDEIELKWAAFCFLFVLIAGVGFGYVVLFSLSPIWMKIGHLLMAHVIWISLVSLAWRVYRCPRWKV